MKQLRSLLWGTFLSLATVSMGETPSSTVHLTVDGIDRFAFVHLPKNYNPLKPPPLLISFHGGVRNAAAAEYFSELDALSDKEGFIVVYPNGEPTPTQVTERTKHLYWNSSHSIFTSNTDDVKFTENLLDLLQTQFPYSAENVFLTGFSAGAQLSYIIACRLANRITAIAAVSGSLEIDDCAPSRPVPILNIHGTGDPMVPYNGGGYFHFQSTPYTVGQWVQMNGCSTTPSEQDLPVLVNDGTSVSVFDYEGCAGNSKVINVVIANGGHAWPGIAQVYPYLYGEKINSRFSFNHQLKFLGPISQNISADTYMWEFFSQYIK